MKIASKLVLLICFLSFSSWAKFQALDAELTQYPYPFPVSFHTVTIKDQSYKMAYMIKKPQQQTKEAVVLLHGKNFSGAYWEKTANELAKAGHLVVMPDQIGFGKSSKPESFPYSFHLLAELTREILQAHKINRYIVVGHSMGGMLATRLALMYPLEVSKLALINPIGLEDWKTKVPYRDVRALYQDELGNNESKIRDYQKNVYYDGKWNDEYEKGIEILVGWTLSKDKPIIAWNAALTTEMVFTQPVVYEFKNLQMPTLLLLGTRDRTAIGKGWAPAKVKDQLGRYDQLGKHVVKLIPKGKLVELDNIGHMPQVEAYERYIKELKDFLR